MNPKLNENLVCLRKISVALSRRSLTNKDRVWLAGALWKIYEGIDPNVVFGIEAGRGQRREVAYRNHYTDLALHLVAGLCDKELGGGKSLDEALQIAAEAFGLNVETLRRYWDDPKNKNLRSVTRNGETYD